MKISQELLKKAMSIHYKANFLVNNLFQGEYASAFKGAGIDFDSVREYQLGDEIRSIDWNVTARTGRTHIKSFKEERELTIMIMIDVSGSSLFGSTARRKRDVAAEVAAILAFAAIKNNDKVGAIIFSDRIEKYLPPQKGKSYVFQVVRDIMETKPTGHATDISGAVEFLLKTSKKRAAVFLISDFLVGKLGTPLRIASKKYDMVALRVADPKEQKMPSVGIAEFLDLETGEVMLVDTCNKTVRERYLKSVSDHTDKITDFFHSVGTDYLELDTANDVMKPLTRLFNERSRRNRAMHR